MARYVRRSVASILCAYMTVVFAADEPSPPVTVKVATVTISMIGKTETGEPRASFGIVNRESTACYAFAPPAGADVKSGESYAVVPASDIDEAIRDEVEAAYPKCKVVDVVARVMR